jgi:hypothetical protein
VTITNRVSLKSVMGGNTPIADVVDAPTIGAATAGTEAATVAYTAATTGGTATSFTAISTPGSLTGTGASPITVSGLTGGTAYTFKVYGTNASGVWSGVQSAASNSVTPAVATSFESIASATGTGSSNTITFSSIPSTYASLQLRVMARDTSNGGTDPLFFFMRMNSDTSVNYAFHGIDADGDTVQPQWDNTANRIPFGVFAASGYATGMMGTAIVDIDDYAVTTKNKTIRSFSGVDRNASTGDLVTLRSGVWFSTAAINTLSITNNGGSPFTTNSVFSLYGIRG